MTAQVTGEEAHVTSYVPVTVGGTALVEDDRASMEVRSPATGELVARCAVAEERDVDAAIAAAQGEVATLTGMGPRQRGKLLFAVADRLEAEAEPIASDLSAEQGKPLTEARGEVAVAVEMWRDAAELVRHLTDELLPSDVPDREIRVSRRPHGVLAVITPWNFPATIPTEYLAAGLAAGNAIVWKPSELTPVTAEHLRRCIAEAGFPPASVNVVPGPGGSVGATLTSHPGIDAVGFTGSPQTGHAVARAAAGRPQLLELGGNNATIVLEDVDVEAAAEQLHPACFANAGQICSSTERIIVRRELHDDLVDALAAVTDRIRLGAPDDPETTMGPLNNRPTLEKVERHLADATDHGARIVTGGRRAEGFPTELYFEPTVVTGLTPQMLAFREETFGPVAFVTACDDDEQAVELANDHDLGLISGVMTDDPQRGRRLAERIEAGIVNVGDPATVWQPHTPFGGASGRRSGVGRLGGRYTIEALTQLRTIVTPRPSG